MSKHRLSHSQLSVARECARKYWYQYVAKRLPVAESKALTFGRAWHEVLERWWLAGPEAAITYLTEQAAEIDPADAALLVALLSQYRPPLDQFQVDSVEQELTVPIVNPESGRPMLGFEMTLRLDVLVTEKTTGELWLVEHKTTSDEIEGYGPYWQRLAIDQQISIYLLATGAVGVIYDVVRKPGIRLCGKDEQAAQAQGILPADAFANRLGAVFAEAHDKHYQFREIRKTPDDLKEAQWDIYQQTLLLRESRKRDLYPRNPNACRSLYGTCPYLEVCVGSAQLEDDALFRNKEERHVA